MGASIIKGGVITAFLLVFYSFGGTLRPLIVDNLLTI